MGLKRFDYKLPGQRKNFKQIAIVLCICLIAVLSFTSYALYEVRHPNDLVDSKVGEFNTSDMSLTVLIDGVKADAFPTKDSGKVFEKLECTNGGSASWDKENWKLSISDISRPTECTVSFKTKQETAVEKLAELAKTNTAEMFTDNTVDANIRYMGADPTNYVSFENDYYNEDLYYGYNSETDKGHYYKYASLAACQKGTPNYYGTYIYNINCEKIHSKGDRILWRIIGIMNNIDDGTGNKETRIKLIRDENIGDIAWDKKCTGTYDETAGTCSSSSYNNNWETSSLNNTLNESFYNSAKNSVANYSVINGSYKWQQLDYSTIGLGNVDKNLIKDAIYYLGGPSSSNKSTLNAKSYYEAERSSAKNGSNPETWKGKIGIMYPSDYGYASSKSSCSGVKLQSWGSTTYTACHDNDWLFHSDEIQWTMTHFSSNANNVMNVYNTGAISDSYSSSDHAYTIRPVVYLKPEVRILNGNGTKGMPYILGI